ncbi:hypothetical protein BTO00_11055 [Vibrio campbellii]|nr:hypothetical protein BTO00_11055 [Vibrio campbellii]
MTSGDAHLAVDNEKILKLGMNGLLEDVRQHRANNDVSTFEGLKKEQFYKSVEIVLLAIQDHIVSYFVQLMLQIKSNGHSVSFGRIDQFLNEFYVRDIENGTIEKDFSLELLLRRYIKYLGKRPIWRLNYGNAGRS